MNEHWEFEPDGLMRRRDASINDDPIAETGRRSRADGQQPTERPRDEEHA